MEKKQYTLPDYYYQMEVLSGGMINQTYKVWPNETSEPQILQALGSMYDERVVEDYHFIASALIQDGWEMPRPLPTNGKDWHRSPDGKVWRSFTYVESTGTPSIDELDFAASGALLARLHTSLAAIFYQPKFVLPHFHDTAYYMTLLSERLKNGFDQDKASDLAKRVINEVGNLPKSTGDDKQLIHGDPRTANMLYRRYTPFTVIDWDTLMMGSVFTDIGDAVRSLVEDMRENDKDIVGVRLSPYLEGYYQNMSSNRRGSYANFSYLALNSAAKIALELTARLLNDISDEPGYFSWEQSVSKSRSEAMLEHAEKQFAVYESIIQTTAVLL